jgi:Ion channel
VQWSYFSLETFLTAGYGFLTIESNLVRLLASLEMLIGYMMGGLLIAILAKKSNRLTNYTSVRFKYNLKAAKPLLERVLSDLWVSTI